MARGKSVARSAPIESPTPSASDSSARSYADVVKGVEESSKRPAAAVSKRPPGKPISSKGAPSSKAAPLAEGPSGLAQPTKSKPVAKTLGTSTVSKKADKEKLSKGPAKPVSTGVAPPRTRISSRIASSDPVSVPVVPAPISHPPAKKTAKGRPIARKTVASKTNEKSSSVEEPAHDDSMEAVPVSSKKSESEASKDAAVSEDIIAGGTNVADSVEKSHSSSEAPTPPPVIKKRKSKEASKSAEEIKRVKLENIQTGKKVSSLGVVKDGVWFCSRRMADKWDVRKSWSIVPERCLKEKIWRVPVVLEAVNRSALLRTIDDPRPSYHQLAMELYANLTEDFGDDAGGRFGEVWVRNACLSITPGVINEVFGVDADAPMIFPSNDDIVSELTKGRKQKWDGKTLFKSADLSSFYACLFYILSYNWLPSKNNQYVSLPAAQLLYEIGQRRKPNFGAYVFEYLCGAAASLKDKKSFGLPYLISRIIKEQAPDIILPTDIESAPLASLQADPKLFEGSHVLDCVRLGGRKALAKEKAGTIQDFRTRKEFMVSWLIKEIDSLNTKKKELETMLLEWKEYGEGGVDDDARSLSEEDTT